MSIEKVTNEDTALMVSNAIAARQIVQGLAAGKTYKQIAQDMNVSRSKLYALLRQEGIKELLYSEIVELESKHQQTIDEMLNSESPTDRRAGMVELGKMIRDAKAKAYPHIHRGETRVIDVTQSKELEQYKDLNDKFTEIMLTYPPALRRDYWRRYKQLEEHPTWRNPQLLEHNSMELYGELQTLFNKYHPLPDGPNLAKPS